MRRVAKDKQKEFNRYHNEVKPKWLEEHPSCEFDLGNGCICGISWGTTIHHKMRRGKFLNDARYYISLCPVHHDWVESNKREARELGYILYK